MKKLSSLAAALVSLLWLTGATWLPLFQQASAPAYTGPGDIQTFSGWWGLRAFSAAQRGTHAISLCDNTGTNCADVLTNATTGVLNSPGTRGANNCNTSGTCLIATFYDQTGNGNNCTQSTAANMAALNMTGGPSGSNPAALFTRANSDVYSCVNTGPSQPLSESVVAERTGTVGSFGTVISYGAQDDLGFGNSANTGYAYAGSILSATANDNAWHAMQGLFNGASGAIYIDGTNTAGTTGSSNPSTNTLMGNGIGGLLDGRMTEAGTIIGNASANFSALNSNQHTFWGF